MDNFNAVSPTISVAVTATASASALLPFTGATSMRIVNEGPNIAFVSVGEGSQTATLPSATAAQTCTPVLSGEDVVFNISGYSQQSISAICRAAGTATLTVQVGVGE